MSDLNNLTLGELYKRAAQEAAADRAADEQRAAQAQAEADADIAARTQATTSPTQLYALAAAQREEAEAPQVTARAQALVEELGLTADDPEWAEAYTEMVEAAAIGREDLYLGAVEKAAARKALREDGPMLPANLSASEIWKLVKW